MKKYLHCLMVVSLLVFGLQLAQADPPTTHFKALQAPQNDKTSVSSAGYVKPTPAPQKKPVQTIKRFVPVLYPSSHVALMTAAGISPSDYGAVEYIVQHESGWRSYAQEPNSGAYGLCQSLPAYKMASAGADWVTNPITQLRWCNSYAAARYGGWWAAQAYWAAHLNW